MEQPAVDEKMPVPPTLLSYRTEQPAVGSMDEKMPVHAATTSSSPTEGSAVVGAADDDLINASGHRQQLDRNFNLVSLCCYAITAGNSWVSLGGTIVRDPLPPKPTSFPHWVSVVNEETCS